MTTYAITGASGQLGRLAAENLLSRAGADDTVVLLTRDPAKLADLAARGADVRAADFDSPDTLAAAFAGVHRVLLVSTDAVGARVRGHQAAIDAAVAAGVERIAYTSLAGADEKNPAAVTPDHLATEQYLRDSGTRWTMLRNNLYADMQVDVVKQAAATGQLVTNVGAGRTAYVTRADCAAAGVGALLSDDASVVDAAIEISGPQALGGRELAELASGIAGRPVEVVDVDDAAYVAGLVEHAGLPEPVAHLLASFGTAAREGYLDIVSDAVRDLGGVEPTPLSALL